MRLEQLRLQPSSLLLLLAEGLRGQGRIRGLAVGPTCRRAWADDCDCSSVWPRERSSGEEERGPDRRPALRLTGSVRFSVLVPVEKRSSAGLAMRSDCLVCAAKR